VEECEQGAESSSGWDAPEFCWPPLAAASAEAFSAIVAPDSALLSTVCCPITAKQETSSYKEFVLGVRKRDSYKSSPFFTD